jgi:hypothetical protein
MQPYQAQKPANRDVGAERLLLFFYGDPVSERDKKHDQNKTDQNPQQNEEYDSYNL